LLIPLALAGAGEFLTQEPSLHTTTNMEVIRHFTGMRFTREAGTHRHWRIAIAD